MFKNKSSLLNNTSLYETLLCDIKKILKRKLQEKFSEIENISEDEVKKSSIRIGDKIHIISMLGEPQYTNRTGTVEYIDNIGLIHGTWGGCAIQPENDEYEII